MRPPRPSVLYAVGPSTDGGNCLVPVGSFPDWNCEEALELENKLTKAGIEHVYFAIPSHDFMALVDTVVRQQELPL